MQNCQCRRAPLCSFLTTPSKLPRTCMMLLNRVTGSLQLCWLHRAAHPHPGFVKCFLAHHHTKTSAGKVRILDSRTRKSSRQHTHLSLHDPREAWRCPHHVVDGLRSAMVVIDKPRPEKNENKRREKPPCCSQRIEQRTRPNEGRPENVYCALSVLRVHYAHVCMSVYVCVRM